MRILLTRHGLTDWNKDHIFQGSTDRDLSPEGLAQAVKLSMRVMSWGAEAVYTSPLKRAFVTAQEIAGSQGLTPIILPELEEIHFGDWEGKSIPQLKAEKPDEFLRWEEDPFFNCPPNAEQWPELVIRLEAAIQTITSGSYERVIAVTHGGIIRAMLSIMLDLTPSSVWRMEISNCSLTCVDCDEWGRFRLVFLNDASHIKDWESE